ncbi:hypothetical protein [Streptomyces sp. G1]|uniref:hypothetical protein n=1 Tax=Streptomyces sp. G1 TaxID=361572 RepID=UPI00202F872A|nr:hypothetical protein [Streptomyces sp. G1]MCM1967772.1 hypothetical protein [Streptomyces sp. G1]
MHCDFCSGPPTFVYVIPPGFLPPIEDGSIRIDQVDDGRWSACLDCAAIIDRQDLAALVKRVIGLGAASGVPGLHDRNGRRDYARILTRMYRAVFSYPLTKENL